MKVVLQASQSIRMPHVTTVQTWSGVPVNSSLFLLLKVRITVDNDEFSFCTDSQQFTCVCIGKRTAEYYYDTSTRVKSAMITLMRCASSMTMYCHVCF